MFTNSRIHWKCHCFQFWSRQIFSHFSSSFSISIMLSVAVNCWCLLFRQFTASNTHRNSELAECAFSTCVHSNNFNYISQHNRDNDIVKQHTEIQLIIICFDMLFLQFFKFFICGGSVSLAWIRYLLSIVFIIIFCSFFRLVVHFAKVRACAFAVTSG